MVIAYLRVSTRAQTKNSSLPRQLSSCREVAGRRGLEVDEVVIHVGSAYHNTRLLEQLVEKCESYPEGGVLIFEHWDRLTRASPNEALPLILRLRSSGWKLISAYDEIL